MSKVVDITEKLSFNENPKLIIKKKELEVNADAATVLKIMGIIGDGDGISIKDIYGVYELMFTEKSRKVIDGLHLSFKDFQTVIMNAINLIVGEGDGGEQ